MQYRAFGSAGEVSVIGQGTWGLDQGDRRAAVEALQRGLDAGMSHIDTAEMYGEGKAEEVIAEAIRDRRDEVFLVSKVLPQNASRQGTVQACERSLARLRTDRLDSYLLHWPSSFRLEDTFAGFEELRAAGKIASWGVSNFDEEELAQAVALAGPGRIVCNQVLYHLEERGIEHAVIPFCEEHGIAVVAYSPFGSGHFPESSSRGGRVLAEIAEAHGVSPRQVALAFLVRRPSLFAIPRTGRAAHAQENAAAADLDLSEDEIRRIDEAFPRGPRRRGVAML